MAHVCTPLELSPQRFAPAAAGSGTGRRRKEFHVVLGREGDDVGRVLLLHVVDAPEQVVELAGRRDPEQALGRLAGLVEVSSPSSQKSSRPSRMYRYSSCVGWMCGGTKVSGGNVACHEKECSVR